MKGFKEHIETTAVANTDFRRVLYTGSHLQLVLMALAPGEEIGSETHTDTDQFFRVESGEGKVYIDEHEYLVCAGDTVIVPSGARHNVVNTSATAQLKLYTLYGPAHHKDGIIRHTKAEAVAQEAEFDGVTTE